MNQHANSESVKTPAKRKRTATAGMLRDLRADVVRLEQRVEQLQKELTSLFTRLHGALDEKDELQRQLTTALVNASKWEAMQAMATALSKHAA